MDTKSLSPPHGRLIRKSFSALNTGKEATKSINTLINTWVSSHRSVTKLVNSLLFLTLIPHSRQGPANNAHTFSKKKLEYFSPCSNEVVFVAAT